MGRDRAGKGKREEASRGKGLLRRENGGGGVEGGELRGGGGERQSREGQEGAGIEGKDS